MTASAEDEARARRVLAAISAGDTEAFGALVADGIEIVTARGTRRGHAEAVAWAANKYDHLERRFAVDSVSAGEGEGVVVEGHTEYVWKDGGELGDASPVRIELRFDDAGKLVLWRSLEG